MNSTTCSLPGCNLDVDPVCPTPWYFSTKPALLPGMSDEVLSMLATIAAYWILSGFFQILDWSNWSYLDKYRIHDSPEVASKNRATKKDVLVAVIFQQVIQTALGYWWLEGRPGLQLAQHCTAEAGWRHAVATVLSPLLGPTIAHAWAGAGAYWVYWWAIPIAQFIFGMFIIDTWQYFLHRAMHMNRFLYKHLHSVHHRLNVPYAYGALYNHPLEGFILDSCGAVLAEACAGMSVRQAALLFSISTFKTVDDHCGYSLPWDPFQWFTQNGADYHDIHHQVIGIKSNFSQPFFVHWDVILGTRMTREDIKARREKKQ